MSLWEDSIRIPDRGSESIFSWVREIIRPGGWGAAIDSDSPEMAEWRLTFHLLKTGHLQRVHVILPLSFRKRKSQFCPKILEFLWGNKNCMIPIPLMSVFSEDWGNVQLAGFCILFRILILANHLLMYPICSSVFMYYLSAPLVNVHSLLRFVWNEVCVNVISISLLGRSVGRWIYEAPDYIINFSWEIQPPSRLRTFFICSVHLLSAWSHM